MDDKERISKLYDKVIMNHVPMPIEAYADMVARVDECKSDTSAYATMPRYSPASWSSISHGLERMVEDIHKIVCDTLPHREAVKKLTELIDEAQCPVDDCKKCKYFNPGSVDHCRTGEKLAEFLIETGLVKVMRHKPIDNPEI